MESVPGTGNPLLSCLVLVAQLCLTLCDPVDCIPPGSSIHGILQARILEWVSISFSRGSSRPRDVFLQRLLRTQVEGILSFSECLLNATGCARWFADL